MHPLANTKNESLIGHYKILQVLSLSVVYILMSMIEKSDLNTPPHSSSRKFVDLHKQVDKLEDYLRYVASTFVTISILQ